MTSERTTHVSWETDSQQPRLDPATYDLPSWESGLQHPENPSCNTGSSLTGLHYGEPILWSVRYTQVYNVPRIVLPRRTLLGNGFTTCGESIVRRTGLKELLNDANTNTTIVYPPNVDFIVFYFILFNRTSQKPRTSGGPRRFSILPSSSSPKHKLTYERP